jgi:hypothetical protein
MYPVRLPQGVNKPCIVYTVRDGVAPVLTGSVCDVKRYTVILKVYSTAYEDGRLITERLTTLLNGLTTTWASVEVVSSSLNAINADYGETIEDYTSILDITMHVR